MNDFERGRAYGDVLGIQFLQAAEKGIGASHCHEYLQIKAGMHALDQVACQLIGSVVGNVFVVHKKAEDRPYAVFIDQFFDFFKSYSSVDGYHLYRVLEHK